MDNAPQKVCGHFSVINELCRRAGVPIYLEGERLTPKARFNIAAIQRLQNMHQGEASQ